MTIEEHVRIAPYTTFCSGGIARFFCVATSEAEVREALSFATKQQIPFFVLGGGSNVLFSDNGFDGLIVCMRNKGISYKETGSSVFVTAHAGEEWDTFVQDSVTRGLWGLENLSLIPGTVGASPVQNIGAYGVETKDVIDSVRVLDTRSGEIKTLSCSECEFGYRTSIFKKKEYKHLIILSVTYKLTRTPMPRLAYKDLKSFFGEATCPSLVEIREAVIGIRQEKFPELSLWGTAGSFWKNPIVSKAKLDELRGMWPELPAFSVSGDLYKIPLAWILDGGLHVKGYTVGHCRLFEKQPLVLVARKETPSHEIDAFASDVEKKVYDSTGITIEREVELV